MNYLMFEDVGCFVAVYLSPLTLLIMFVVAVLLSSNQMQTSGSTAKKAVPAIETMHRLSAIGVALSGRVSCRPYWCTHFQTVRIMSSKKRPFLPGYLSSLERLEGKK